ncbi:MAG: hypothetical protein V3T70_01210, partial [Phycisphaerae bacterium]
MQRHDDHTSVPAPHRPDRGIFSLVLILLLAMLVRLPWLVQPGFRIDQLQFITWAHQMTFEGMAA